MILMLLHVTAYGQYSISGTVRNGNEAVAGASVTLEPSAQRKLSNDNGFFRFGNLPAGTYTITVTTGGFKAYTQGGERYK